MIPRTPALTAALLASATLAQTPQFTTAPAAHSTTDAISYEWFAGASRPLRQQTLVGPSHLQGMLGRTITAIELRRNAANEVYQGGTANLTVTLSIAPHGPLQASHLYQQNRGPTPILAFSGSVTLPTSPATQSQTVAWSPANTVRIPLQTPFLYQGGTLLVDIEGQPIAGQNANWWMADAAFEDLKGSTAQLGAGCGLYGGQNHEWSHVATRTLLPGAPARFWAHGTPNGLGFAVFGLPSPLPIPLSQFGIPTPNCNLHLLPALILASTVAVFEPEASPLLAAFGGIAETRLKLPAATWLFGFSLATQWFDLAQMASSNAIQWTVASAIPSLDMALVEGDPNEVGGEVTVHLAHVLRFEHQ